jgi:hypothetical protein
LQGLLSSLQVGFSIPTAPEDQQQDEQDDQRDPRIRLRFEDWQQTLHTEFHVKGLSGFSIEFKSNESGAITEAILIQPNSVFTAKRRQHSVNE